MLVILLAVYAVLVQNGDSNCLRRLEQDVQVCMGELEIRDWEAQRMSDNKARIKKICCSLKDFDNCMMAASKKCGSDTEDFTKQALQMAKKMRPSSCTDQKCNSGNSIVLVNALVSYLPLYLSFFLCSNIF